MTRREMASVAVSPVRSAALAALPMIVGALAAMAPAIAMSPAAAAAEGSGVTAIIGGTIHTLGPDGVIKDGIILMENGRIQAVGRKLKVPPGARRIEASGRVITPGFFDGFSSLGLVEIGQVGSTREERTQNARITAAFDVADGLNPRSTLLAINRVEGITRALVAPAPGTSLVAGQAAIIHLDGDGGDVLVRRQAAMLAVLGDGGAAQAGGSRAAALLILKEALQDARDRSQHQAAYDRGERRDYALSRLDLEALDRVIRRDMPLMVAVSRASDIETALRFAAEEKVKMILIGAEEGWMVAARIAAAGVPVILDPMQNRPASFERLGATLENAARLQAAGVTIAFMSGGAHNSRNLKQAAGNAVASGLDWEAALRALTLNPARIFGLEKTSGSIQSGRDADLVIWDGDPLEVTSAALHVLIRGREMPRETRQTRLRDRYIRLDGAWPPAYSRPAEEQP